MRKVLLSVLVILLALTSFGGCSADGKSDDIVILFTNDVHCAVDDNIGYAGLAAYKKSVEKKAKYVALVDAGDAVQGSYLGTVSEGEIIVEIMNQVGYDVATFGNHEFDYGMDRLKELVEMSDAEYVASNIIYSGKNTSALEDIKPYKIMKFGKTSVAFIGVITPTTIAESTPAYFREDGEYVYDFCSGENGKELWDCAQKYVDETRKKGADYVVLLSHLGTDEFDIPYTSTELAANTNGVDVIIDAHSHSEIPCKVVRNKDSEEVFMAQTGTKLENIGQLVITKNGWITMGFVSDYDEKDEETATAIESLKEKYGAKLNEVVMHTDFELPIADKNGIRMIRSREMSLGDFTADAYRWVTGADIAYVNGGGIRTSIKAGDITYSDLISVNPFGNMICMIKVTGQELLDMLEVFYCNTQGEYVRDGEEYGSDGSFGQFSGIKLTIHTKTPSSVVLDGNGMLLSVGETRRVSDVYVLKNGEYVPLDVNAEYTFASHDYMIKNGGCSMELLLKDKEILLDSITTDYQALVDYAKSLEGDISAYKEAQGRITVED